MKIISSEIFMKLSACLLEFTVSTKKYLLEAKTSLRLVLTQRASSYSILLLIDIDDLENFCLRFTNQRVQVDKLGGT